MPRPCLVEAVAVVHLLRAVERDAQQPVVLAEQLAPALVEQDARWSGCVADVLPVAAVLLLEFHQLLEERQAGQGRLAALEREHAVRVGVEQVGIHQAFQRFRGHAAAGQRLVGIGLAVQVKAVGAIQVADRRGGLDQQRRDARRQSAPVLAEDW